MRVLSLSSSDTTGGAAIAACRLHQGLRMIGIESHMHVQRKNGDDQFVTGGRSILAKFSSQLREHIDMSPTYLYRYRQKIRFSPAWLPGRAWLSELNKCVDIVHLHWINNGYIRIEDLALLRTPIIWTLHDMWAFTGGCHYDDGCGRYTTECGNCPILGSNKRKDLAYRVYERKRNAWRDLNLTLVSPSHWLTSCARQSTLLSQYRIKTIPNGLDLSIFKPIQKYEARIRCKLPQDKKLILFGAMNATSDPRKGYMLLKTALQKVSKKIWESNIGLILFGNSKSIDTRDFGYPVFCMGSLYDNTTISSIYSAADLFVAPSIQDNLPNTVMESLACGTPCVAFNIGGMPDMIEHKLNGYLAKAYDTDDLANGIMWILNNVTHWPMLSRHARNKAQQEFGIVRIANQYCELYKEITELTRKKT